jgi:large subunit ribosomal protein L18
MQLSKSARRSRIHKRIRKRISGSASLPRVSVFRSNTQIYAQLIDDVNGKTLLAVSSKENGIAASGKPRVEQSKEVGKLLAEKATAAGFSQVVFDRSGYLYHGRIKALADGAREGGLKL